MALSESERLLGGQLLPQLAIASLDRGGLLDEQLAVLRGKLAQLRRDIEQPSSHVLDDEVELVGAPLVRDHRLYVAGLGVDQVGLQPLTVADEQGVRERA